MNNSTILELELLDRLKAKKFDMETLYKLRDLFYALPSKEMYEYVSGEINGFDKSSGLPNYRRQNDFIINNNPLKESHREYDNTNIEISISILDSLDKLLKNKANYIQLDQINFCDKEFKDITDNEIIKNLKYKDLKINFKSFESKAIQYYLNIIEFIIDERLIKKTT
jgi:hypothetical protein